MGAATTRLSADLKSSGLQAMPALRLRGGADESAAPPAGGGGMPPGGMPPGMPGKLRTQGCACAWVSRAFLRDFRLTHLHRAGMPPGFNMEAMNSMFQNPAFQNMANNLMNNPEFKTRMDEMMKNETLMQEYAKIGEKVMGMMGGPGAGAGGMPGMPGMGAGGAGSIALLACLGMRRQIRRACKMLQATQAQAGCFRRRCLCACAALLASGCWMILLARKSAPCACLVFGLSGGVCWQRRRCRWRSRSRRRRRFR